MKCPICDGGGRIMSLPSGMPVKCTRCNGTGEIEHTNEEWFNTLTTEEKAEFFHNIVIRAMQATWDGKKPGYPAYLSDWKKWLKEKHNDSR